MARVDTEDIGDHIFKWCVGEGSGTPTAEKLAQLYVSVHFNRFQSAIPDEEDERYQYLSKTFLEFYKNHGACTKSKEAVVLSALYDIH